MTVYEMRTYTLHVGKMGEAVKLYSEFGYPALEKGGQAKKLIGYFQADTGMINQLVHLWKFDDDADRRGPRGDRIPEKADQILAAASASSVYLASVRSASAAGQR
jgi:hypothetical protein